MDIAIIGTGFIGGTLGHALVGAGHRVTFGRAIRVRPTSPEQQRRWRRSLRPWLTQRSSSSPSPGSSVAELTSGHRDALAGKLVIDATNQMGAEVTNARSDLPTTVRYARAFNTVGGENIADPVFADGKADMFFSGPEVDRTTVETVIEDVGLRPVYVGEDEEVLIDNLFRLWIAWP